MKSLRWEETKKGQGRAFSIWKFLENRIDVKSFLFLPFSLVLSLYHSFRPFISLYLSFLTLALNFCIIAFFSYVYIYSFFSPSSFSLQVCFFPLFLILFPSQYSFSFIAVMFLLLFIYLSLDFTFVLSLSLSSPFSSFLIPKHFFILSYIPSKVQKSKSQLSFMSCNVWVPYIPFSFSLRLSFSFFLFLPPKPNAAHQNLFNSISSSSSSSRSSAHRATKSCCCHQKQEGLSSSSSIPETFSVSLMSFQLSPLISPRS